jgi:hypothetical protein
MSLTDNHWFKLVRGHIDSMLEFGRGSGTPLFGGVIDIGKRRVSVALTPPPPGIRISDFNWCGNNLMHDIPLLEVMIALTKLTGDARYDQAVDEMCAWYASNCPHPQTGLFPWGEHAQWSFADQGILPCSFTNGMASYRKDGSIIHDHLRFAPGWFWERLWKAKPQVVVNFAKGLNGHIVDVKTFEHNRHAVVAGPWWRDPNNPTFDKGADFARHSGFFIFDTLFAFKHSGDRSLLDWARRKLAWHLTNRHPNGLIRGCVRTADYEGVGQHDALALCVADAADMLGRETTEGREFAQHADDLFDARRRFYAGKSPNLPTAANDPRLWLCGYTRKNLLPEKTMDAGNILADMFKRTGIPWYGDQLAAVGRWLVQNLPDPPENVPLMPRAFYQHTELMLLAHQLTGDRQLLDRADRVAASAEKRLWAGEMFKGVSDLTFYGSGTNYEFYCDPWATHPSASVLYHSITGTPSLVRTLLQLALVQEGQLDVLGIDAHRRY